MADEIEVFYDNAVVEVLPATDVDVIEIVEEGPQGSLGPPGTGVDEFLDLLDTPDSYVGEANKNVSVKADESGLEFTTPPASSFLALTDTPDTYVDQAGKLASVKGDESGLDFINISPSYYSEIWTWTTKLTDADTNGQIGLNANTWALATQLNVNDRTTGNRDMSLAFAELFHVGDKVLIQQKTDATRRGLYLISAPGTDQGNWWSFPLTLISSAGAVPGGNADTVLTILVTGGSGAGAVGANPTAEVGLTPINGTADTFMRSDAAPPLDQAISPIWTGDHVFQGSASAELPVDPENVANKEYVDSLTAPSGSRLISGGGVAWTGAGLNFIVSAATYLINGVQYSSVQTPLTLAAADPTFDRIDVFAVNDAGVALAITGVPGGPPVEPQVDPATQLKLTSVFIAAGATSPAITSENIYLENVEWVGTASSSSINPNSTNNPYAGTKDIEGTSVVNGVFVTCVKPSGTLKPSDYATLVFQIRSKALWPSSKALSIFWMNGATFVGVAANLKHGTRGFDSSNTTSYQQIAIPASVFNTGASLVDRLRIQVTGGGSSIGWYIDNIVLQTGGGGGGVGGDFSTNTNTSIPDELVLFADTTGKLGKRSTMVVTNLVQKQVAYATPTTLNQVIQCLKDAGLCAP